MLETAAQKPSLGKKIFVFMLRHPWVLGVTVLIVVTLILQLWLRFIPSITGNLPLQSSAPALTIKSFANDQYNLGTVEYRGIPPVPPASFDVYTSEAQPEFRLFASQLIKKLDLKAHRNIPNMWTAPDDKQTYLFEQDRELVRYTQIPSFNVEPILGIIEEEKAITEAKKFLIEHTITPAFQPIPASITRNDGNDHGGAVAADQPAAYIVIPFEVRLGNVPVYYKNLTLSTGEVWLNPEYKVVKASFPPYTSTPRPEYAVPSLPFANVLDQIRGGNFSVVDIAPKSGGFTAINNFNRVILNETTLEYRYDPTSGSFYPYYLIKGLGIQSDAVEADISLITPAIVTTP